MFRVEPRRRHWTFKVERQPFLDSLHTGPLRQVHEQHQVQHQRSGQNRVPAEKVDLYLHWIPQPTGNIDVVPALLGVAARRVIVDADRVVEILVQHRVKVRL